MATALLDFFSVKACWGWATADNMPLNKTRYFHSVNIGTIPRFFAGKKLDTWDNSLYLRLIEYALLKER